jgi:uncharacterized membrane protein YedE/YeeE
VIGAAAMFSNFCALGAVSDILFAKDWRRMRSWGLAAGVAVIGTQALIVTGLVDLSGNELVAPNLPWVSLLLGGIMFGYGMSLSGGCINRALVRLGAGSLKSLVILIVVALTAAMLSFGLLRPLADALDALALPLATATSLPVLIAQATGLPFATVGAVVGVLIGGGLIAFALTDHWFRTSGTVMACVAIGLMIPAGFLASGLFDPDGAAAVNFAAPAGDGAAFLLGFAVPMFAVTVTVGVPIGAFIIAAATRNLALETFTDRADLPRNLIGAALMGFGGTLALGCTFGQGLSGFGLLGLGAFIVIAGIFFGCLWGIRAFEAGGVWGGLALTFKRN